MTTTNDPKPLNRGERRQLQKFMTTTNEPSKPMSRGQRRRLQKYHEEQQRRLAMAPTKREVATYVRNEMAKRTIGATWRRLLSWLNQRVSIRSK